MTITLSDLCRGLAKNVYAVEYYNSTDIDIRPGCQGDINLGSDSIRRLFHAVRLIKPDYFRMVADVNQFSIYCSYAGDGKSISLRGGLDQICNAFIDEAARLGILSRSKLDLECTLSGLN